MIIDVSQLIKEHIGTTWRYGFRETGESPVSGEVSLLRTDKGIFVSGTIETTFKGVCSRCLVPIEQPLTLHFEEEYSSEADEGAFAISGDKEIDLSEAVRQYFLLAIPMKPLCREDCAGLCPTCGHNLNLGPCDCAPRDIDPRLAQLAMLISDRKGQEK
jgi:uncharacterized protein